MKYVLVSVVVLIIGLTGIFTPLKNTFNYVVSPLQFGLRKSAVDIKDVFNFYSHLTSIQRENIKLLEDKIALESRILELKIFEEENVSLKNQLDVKNTVITDRDYIISSVMGNPEDLSGSTFMIDKGSKHGIQKGDNVIVGKYLVGVVKQASPVKSIVELITSPSLSISVYNIDSPEKTEGIAAGEHGSSVVVSKILPKENSDIGDIFVTSGKEGLVLPGLYVGKVSRVNFEPSQPLKSAVLQTVFDIYRLDRVFVLIQKDLR